MRPMFSRGGCYPEGCMEGSFVDTTDIGSSALYWIDERNE
jgi:hypothetical protein